MISSCALIRDGKLLFASPEERFTRNKNSRQFPMTALKYGLASIGAGFDDVDAFAIGWNPAVNIQERYRAGFSEWPAYPGERFYSNPNRLLPQLTLPPLASTRQQFVGMDGGSREIMYVTHHLAHISFAYAASGFEEACVMSCDGYGERASMVYATVKAGCVDILKEVHFPHSIGQLYSTLTQFLGFSPDSDEWKVMGAAAYGNSHKYRAAIESLIPKCEEGEIALDLHFFDHFNFDSAYMYSSALCDLLRLSPRKSDEPLLQEHYDLAAALQAVVEDILTGCAEWLKQTSGLDEIWLTGGVHMNSVFNGKLTSSRKFKKVYIPFAPDDSGNAIGAALWAAGDFESRETSGPVRVKSLDVPVSPYLGLEYSDCEILEEVEKLKLKFDRPENLMDVVTDYLIDGHIVGWFQGRMEFGQRALGNRSILADPRVANMKEKINSAIKYREAFRPFAPAILRERVSEFFEDAEGVSVPYMEKVLMVRPEKQSVVPAIVHEDGSGRLQTVDKGLNEKFHALIQEFDRKTGVPVLLNTSFNINGEPIVLSPSDAVRTFYSSGLDKLVLGDIVISK